MVRRLAQQAGALLLLCAIAAILAAGLNGNLISSSPGASWVHVSLIALAALQIVACILIWRIFLTTRDRFAQRLQAASGGLEDRIFVADRDGTGLLMLTDKGWSESAAQSMLGAVHPDDQPRWHIGQSEAQASEVRLRSQEGKWRWYRIRTIALRNADGSVREWVGTIHDIHDEKVANDRRDLVIGELRHRLKNLVTVIDALAKNSLPRAGEDADLKAYLQRFLGRLHALGTAGDLVLAASEKTIDTDTLIRATLAPFMSDAAKQRFHIYGPKLALSDELGASLGLAIHELATNALKYGALSVPHGFVSLTWTVAPTVAGDEIVLIWKETGGPPPPPVPAKPGFGTRLIKAVVAREKYGNVEFAYQPDGVHCRISFTRERAKPAQPALTPA